MEDFSNRGLDLGKLKTETDHNAENQDHHEELKCS
jgi:hypothetical protein